MKEKIDLLLLDDDKFVTDVLDKSFSELKIKSFSNPESAIKSLENYDYKLAIIDFALPKMNGLEVTKIIKRKSPNTGIIIFTGITNDIELVMNSYEAGAIDIIEKPCKIKTLKEKIFTALNNHKELEKEIEIAKATLTKEI